MWVTCMGISLPHGLERGYQPRPLGMIKFQCTIAFPFGIVEELFPKALLVEFQKEKANQAFSPTFCGSSLCFSNVFHHLLVDASISRYFSRLCRTITYRSIWEVHIDQIGDQYGWHIPTCQYAPQYHVLVHQYVPYR